MRLVAWLIPSHYMVMDVNGYKLGFTIGKGKGLDSLSGRLILRKGYEVQTTFLFNDLVKQGMVVVDVGAHIGYYTILASKLVGNQGKVWAFEPEPNNYENLIKNIKLNKAINVMPIRKAVSDKDGIGRLFVSEYLSGECSLVNIKKRHTRSVAVDTVILDNTINQKIDVIKVDVDGNEMAVLAGAHNLLEQNKDILLFTEIWKIGLEEAGYSCEDYWNKLMQYGLHYIYLIDDRKRYSQLTTLNRLLEYLQMAEGVNLLCSKSDVLGEYVPINTR